MIEQTQKHFLLKKSLWHPRYQQIVIKMCFTILDIYFKRAQLFNVFIYCVKNYKSQS